MVVGAAFETVSRKRGVGDLRWTASGETAAAVSILHLLVRSSKCQ